MGFNENTFIIAAAAVAMFGVGLYIYDTRKEQVTNTFNKYRTPNTYAAAPPTNSTDSQGLMMPGGSRKNRKRKF